MSVSSKGVTFVPKQRTGGVHMQVEWRQIREFPSYSVSDTGYIRNDETDRIMSPSVNQHGVVHVGLMRGPRQHKRSLALLVAEAFIERPKDAFDTPIHLDGDRYNNDTSNLLWRPLWFARKYSAQFAQSGPSINRPVEIVETGEAFETSFSAATCLGLLDREIAISIMTKNYVWPINKQFRVVGSEIGEAVA